LPCCRALGKLVHLTGLRLGVPEASLEPRLKPDVGKFCPLLPSLRFIYLAHFGSQLQPSLHALARWTRLPPGASVEMDTHGLSPELRLSVKGWGCGWLPAVLAGKVHWQQGARYAVIAVDDSDVDRYLSLVASMSPNQQRGRNHVVWLGEQVTPVGFSRLLSCTQQPALRLEVNPAAELAQLQPFALPGHVRALAGVAAPLLMSLVVGDCQQLTNRDVAVLAGACHALQEVTLKNALLLTDPALHSLAGCRQLERVQLTHASVTEEGVVVVLVTLRGLKELVLGNVPAALDPAALGRRVLRELTPAEQQQWVVGRDEPSDTKPCIAWRRRPGPAGRGAIT
jgi:hypothetical protein